MIVTNNTQIKVSYNDYEYYIDLLEKKYPVSKAAKKKTGSLQVKDDQDDDPYFVVYTTDVCNMRCSYCFNEIDKQKSNIRSTPSYKPEDFVKLIHSNFPNRKINIRFFGGEPLINKKWIYEIVEKLKSEKIEVGYDIFTNATLVDNDFLRFAKKNNFQFYVSVNGGVDQYKGSIFKNEIANGIRKLSDAGFYVIGRMVWIPSESETLKDLVVDAFDSGINAVSITLPWGEKRENSLVEDQINELTEFYISQIIKHNFKYIGVAPFVSYISKWILNQNYNAISCSAGKSMYSINTKGECYPCQCFNNNTNFKIGDVQNLDKNLFEKLTADTMYPCKECSIKYFCKAKCAADGYYANGNYMHMNESRCKVEKMIVGASAYILYTLQQYEKEYNGYRIILSKVSGCYNNNK